MNENSPIWVSPTPTRRAVQNVRSNTQTTRVRTISLPITTKPTIAPSRGRWLTTLNGSMRAPTVTKNRATNASRKDSRRASVSWA